MSGAHVTERDLRLFRALDLLLEERSVTRAAARLGVTQSAVSHMLRALRERMGDPLVVRTSSGLQPTPLATAMQPTLRESFIGLQQLLQPRAAFDPATARRAFSLATPDHPLFTVLPDLVERLAHEAPAIDIRLRPIGPKMAEELADGALDLVMGGPAVAEAYLADADLKQCLVISEPFRCVVRRGHPAVGEHLDLETFCRLNHVLVSPSGRMGGVVDRALAELNVERRVALTVPSFPAEASFVAATDMIATLPNAVAARAALRYDVQDFSPPLPLPRSEAFLWWHPRFHNDPGHAWWRDTLVRAFAPHRGG